MGRRYRGMVLAAGLGTRLRPLTDVIPKPLIPIGPERLIESAIRRLVRAGVVDIVVNLHHLAEQIPAALGSGERLGARLSYSFEPEILGTGGGIKKVSEFFEDGPFVVANSDMVTDVELEPAIQQHESTGALATLVVQARSTAGHSTLLVDDRTAIHDIAGQLGVGEEGFLPVNFIGMQVYEPGICRRLPDGASETPKDLWIPILRELGPTALSAYVAHSYFSDVGTWDSLLETHRQRLPSQHPAVSAAVRIKEPVFIDDSARLVGEVDLGPGVTVGAGASIQGPASLSDAIVLAGATLGPGTYRSGVACKDRFIVAPRTLDVGA